MHHGIVGDGVGVIPGAFRFVFGVVLRSDLGVVASEGIWVEERSRAVNGAEEFVKSALAGPVVLGRVVSDLGRDVPFAGEVSAVAGGLESLGNGHAFLVEESLILREAVVAGHMSNSGLVGVEPGEKRGAGGAATAGVVELREAQAVGGEFVEIRGFDFPAVTSDVGIAHVIGHDDNDVWAGFAVETERGSADGE